MITKIINSIKFRFSKFLRRNFKNEESDLKKITSNLNIEIQTIFDIGANVGTTVKTFHRNFPNAIIHAFEPNPSVFNKLEKNYKSNSKVILNNIGVGDKNGILKLNRHINSGATSFKDPNNNTNPDYNSKIIDKIDVQVKTLKEYISNSNIDNIDILKIDVEGFEMEVLNGIDPIYLSEKIKLVMIESNLIEKMIGQGLIEDIITILRKSNFTLYNIYDLQESKKYQLYIVNLIFVNNKFIKL